MRGEKCMTSSDNSNDNDNDATAKLSSRNREDPIKGRCVKPTCNQIPVMVKLHIGEGELLKTSKK